MIVYLSGPITGIVDYKDRFQAVADKLLEQGHIIVNPANMDMVADGGLEYEDYIRLDMALLEACDAICLLPGWQNSTGAKRERARARELRLVEMEAVDR